MSPWAAGYLFLLGLAAGIAILTITGYFRMSPPWVRWLLTACGAFVMFRYVAMFVYATMPDPGQAGWVRHCWYATSLALPLQTAFATDQLIRHPAMTPRKLLTWCAPFVLLYAAVILFGRSVPVPDRIVGWTLRLAQPWQSLLSLTHVAFVVGYVGIAALLFRKIPVAAIRAELGILMLAQLLLAADGLVLAFGGWYFRPYLFTEMFALVAVWHAHRTAASLA